MQLLKTNAIVCYVSTLNPLYLTIPYDSIPVSFQHINNNDDRKKKK